MVFSKKLHKIKLYNEILRTKNKSYNNQIFKCKL